MQSLEIPDRKYWANPDVLSPSDLLAGGGVSQGGGAGDRRRPPSRTHKRPIQEPNILEPSIDDVLEEILKRRASRREDSRRKTAQYLDALLRQAPVPGRQEEEENLRNEGIKTWQSLGRMANQSFKPFRLPVPGNIGDVRFRGDIRLPRTTRLRWYQIIEKMKRPPIPRWDLSKPPPEAGGPEERGCARIEIGGNEISICKAGIIKIHGQVQRGKHSQVKSVSLRIKQRRN